MRSPENGREVRAETIAGWPEALRAHYEERAAIREYQSGEERAWAELEAFCEVKALESAMLSTESLSRPRSQERRAQ